MHADIASRLNRLIDEKFLVEMGKLEQDLVYGNATSKEVVTFLGYHQQLPTEDKVRSFLFMLESQSAADRVSSGADAHQGHGVNPLKQNEGLNEDYIIPATSRLIRRRITVSVSSSNPQQHRQAISDTQDRC